MSVDEKFIIFYFIHQSSHSSHSVCQIEAKNTLKIVFLLNSVKSDLMEIGANSTLLVAKVNKTDSGNYTCSIGGFQQYTTLIHVLNGKKKSLKDYNFNRKSFSKLLVLNDWVDFARKIFFLGLIQKETDLSLLRLHFSIIFCPCIIDERDFQFPYMLKVRTHIWFDLELRCKTSLWVEICESSFFCLASLFQYDNQKRRGSSEMNKRFSHIHEILSC